MASIKTISPPEPGTTPRESRRFLPRIGSLRYHLLPGAVAIFIQGPVGGGLIAGDSLAALGIGIVGLLTTLP
jgi:hypothetical protein